MKLPLVGQAYENRSLAASAQRCVNLYPEVIDTPGGGREVSVLHGTPGLKSPLAQLTNPIHGMCVMGETVSSAGKLYAVSGNTLYSVTTDGTTTSLGAISGNGRASMAVKPVTTAATDSGTEQLCIVNGSAGYIYDTTNGLQKITDAQFVNAYIVQYLKGYFVFPQRDTDYFFNSEIGDGLTYASADFGQASSNGDTVISLLTDHEEAWVFGSKSIEIYYIPGDQGTAFPFVKVQGTHIERGCAARYTPVKVDNSVIWLGDDLIVYRANGYVPQRISHHAIEKAIRGYTTRSDAFAWTYTDEGHTFYVLTFPTDGATWVYDLSTNMWHERESFGLNRWRANCYAKFNGKHYVGDYANGNIYELDLDTYTENGTTIQRIRSTNYFHAETDPIFMDWLEVEFESGVGLITGQGSDPQMILKYSDDGMRTWSNGRLKTMGAIGDYGVGVRWNRLGRFKQRVFEVSISDPVKVAISGAATSADRADK